MTRHGVIRLVVALACVAWGYLWGYKAGRRKPHMTKVRIRRNEFGWYIVVLADDFRSAWSGARWVPVDGFGFPAADVQVSNFDSVEHATEYAQSFGFTVLE